MRNEYLRRILIAEIENALDLAKKEKLGKREKILFEMAKNIMIQILKQHFKTTEQRKIGILEAVYVVERIILAEKQKQVKTLHQTYREYKEEGGEIPSTIKEERLDEVMSYCPTMLKDTKEALDLIYENADKYYEKSMKED